ncbi:MAG: Succinate dehydrogenase/fumarate reductase, flavoprotein subunit [Deltaproteobacteria bacterium]|nr:Succinate dehydrogenase/fumarate reductase, flavoprotein subunit [Deltaproteobacteria bacterium]
MKPYKNQGSNELHTDIVVIGSGGGLAAALAAAEGGAKVTLLEKRKVFGGNTALARALLAAESPVQKRLRIDARKEDLFKASMSFSHWKINPDIIRTFINKSGDTIRWLEEMGVRFQDVPNAYFNQVPRIYHLPEGYGAALIKVLVKKCEELGVTLLKETPARKILVRKGKGVTSILGGSRDKKVMISAKSAIIATGGYSGNKELLKRYCPNYTEDAHVHGIPHMGDGIVMAREAGAASEGLGSLLSMGPFFTGSLQVGIVSVEANTIWVNKRGERFADESTHIPSESANALDRQPDRISFSLFDETIKQSFIDEGLLRGHHRLYPPGSRMVDIDKHLRKEVREGRVKVSDSWETIARWIGADPEKLKHNIKAYNDSCDRGFDELFYKDRRYLQPLKNPPYYALICHQAFHGTTGGIKINERMEVLDEEDGIIPGLFAAGNDTGGWASDTYNYVLTGTAFAYAINSARIAGENAAEYINR